MPQCLYNPGVRIKRAVWKNVTDTCFIDKKTKADIFSATVASSFQRNVTISYYSIGIKLPFSIVLKTRQWRSTLPCTTSVLFRTTFTRTIILNPLMK